MKSIFLKSAIAFTIVVTAITCITTQNTENNRSDYARLLGEDPDELSAAGMYKDMYNLERYYRNVLNVEREGKDVLTAVLERAREHHLETFITYRMNDLHFCVPDETPKGYSDFWMQHPEYRIGESFGWNSSGAYDFAHSEVRAFKAEK